MRIVIERVDNGAIVEYPSEDGLINKAVFEFGSDNLEGASSMLWDVLDKLWLNGSRHDRERLVIRREHGDKYECNDKDCEICQQNSWARR
jgi:hypothetical protein